MALHFGQFRRLSLTQELFPSQNLGFSDRRRGTASPGLLRSDCTLFKKDDVHLLQGNKRNWSILRLMPDSRSCAWNEGPHIIAPLLNRHNAIHKAWIPCLRSSKDRNHLRFPLFYPHQPFVRGVLLGNTELTKSQNPLSSIAFAIYCRGA